MNNPMNKRMNKDIQSVAWQTKEHIWPEMMAKEVTNEQIRPNRMALEQTNEKRRPERLA